jgi:hypothetical protein
VDLELHDAAVGLEERVGVRDAGHVTEGPPRRVWSGRPRERSAVRAARAKAARAGTSHAASHADPSTVLRKRERTSVMSSGLAPAASCRHPPRNTLPVLVIGLADAVPQHRLSDRDSEESHEGQYAADFCPSCGSNDP